jgi:hypothetical protein
MSSSASNSASTIKANDETTPLLATSTTTPIGETAEAEQPSQADGEAPLPRAQILILCYASLIEPMAFFAIFPYINKMIELAGNIDQEDVGFYAGTIESLFSATQMCVMIFWGKVRYVLNLMFVASASDLRRLQTAWEGSRSFAFPCSESRSPLLYLD